MSGTPVAPVPPYSIAGVLVLTTVSSSLATITTRPGQAEDGEDQRGDEQRAQLVAAECGAPPPGCCSGS